jgi:hypothetical protein
MIKMSILEKIANTASAVYKSTAFKVGTVLYTASVISGCFKDYFTSIIPPDRWQAELSAGDGWGIRARTESDEDESNSAEFSHTESDHEVEATGNAISEERTALDVRVKPLSGKEFTVRPMRETLERTVLTPAGLREALTTGTFLASDLGFGDSRGDKFLLVRPYSNTEEEESVAGNSTVKQSGVYAAGRYGKLSPLLSLEFYDFGSGLPKASEFQLGTFLGNNQHSIGYFLVSIDDGTDQDVKHVLIGDTTVVSSGNKFIGADVTYDGSLAGAGVHGAWSRKGGNMPAIAKGFKRSLRDLQSLTFLERGLPESIERNMRSDIVQALQGIEDVTLFYLLGVRQEYDLAKDDNVARFYAMAGTNFGKVTAGATYGNVLQVYPADAVEGRGGPFLGFNGGGGRLHLAWEKIDFKDRKDTSALTVVYMVPFK